MGPARCRRAGPRRSDRLRPAVPRRRGGRSPPKPGDTVTAGQACGDIESVKSVSDLVAPVTGTARARNDDLAEAPDLVNTDPYGQGWLFEIQTDPTKLDQQLAALMDADAYHGLVGA